MRPRLLDTPWMIRVSTCYAADVLKCSRAALELHPSFRRSDYTVAIPVTEATRHAVPVSPHKEQTSSDA